MLFFSKTDVLSFRWVPSLSVYTSTKIEDTVYFSQKKVADYMVMLTYSNITLWHSSSSSALSQGNFSDLNWDIISKALTAIKNLNTVRTTNVLQVSNSDDSIDGVALLLQQAQIILSQSQSLIQPLDQMIEEEQSRIDACTADKALADELYNEWLATQQATQVSHSTLQAQEASTCIATATVSLRSKNGVLKNLTTEITKTQNFVEIVTRNKDLIVQYDSILDGTIPSELVQVQKELSVL